MVSYGIRLHEYNIIYCTLRETSGSRYSETSILQKSHGPLKTICIIENFVKWN